MRRLLRYVWGADAVERDRDRMLTTVLFIDVVGSTSRAVELGDRGWRDMLKQYRALVRAELARARGREIDTAGDGFLASFDRPAHAIHCACAIRQAMNEHALELRFGLHTGECEMVDGKVAGIAVHTGARVAAHARSGEVLVSSTVKDVVAGSELEFRDRGMHTLDGIPGQWHLYAAA